MNKSSNHYFAASRGICGQPYFFAHHPVIIGTRIAVTTTAAAICVVASPTKGAQLGSTKATAAGVAIEFPAADATAHPA